MATADAVNQASRLSEIGFPEFTAKLVTDVFDALVSANVRQTESYLALIKEVGKTLSQYINDTKDDIGGEEIMQFLALVAPPDNAGDGSTEPSKVKVGNSLSQPEAHAIQAAVNISGETVNHNAAAAGAIDQAAYEKIVDAVASRIGANKYDLLKEMVKQGILRLVVENGVIETRLTFTTYGSSFYQGKSTD